MAHAMSTRSTIDVMPPTSVLVSRSSGPCSYCYSVRGSEAERRHLNEDDDGSDVSG